MLSTPNVSPRSFSKWLILLHKFYHAWLGITQIIVKMYYKELSLIAFPNVQTDVILVHSSYLFSSRDRRTFFCSFGENSRKFVRERNKMKQNKIFSRNRRKKLELELLTLPTLNWTAVERFLSLSLRAVE